MKSFKVLFTTHQTAFLNQSGGEIELLQTLYFFRSHGIDADLFDSSSTNLDKYDFYIHFGTNLDGLHLLQKCKKIGKPIVLFPNLWFNDTNISNINIVESFCKLADYFFFKSQAELNNFLKYVSIDCNKVFITPLGIDTKFFSIKSELGETFKKLYGLDVFLLWIGSFSPEQGQLEFVKNLYDFDFPIVFIGAPNDEKYLLDCIESSNQNNIFIRSASHGSDLILGAIEGCSLYLELKVGPAGLSALEAGASGKKILLNQNSWTTENFGEYVLSVTSPYDYDAIKLLLYNNLDSDFYYDEMLSKYISNNHNLDICCNNLFKLLKKFYKRCYQ